MTVVISPHDTISWSLYVLGEYELDAMRDTLTFLRSLGYCQPRGRGTVIDLGANNGVTCVGMLHAGEFARAIAIEPEPGNHALLQRNVVQNGLQGRVTSLAAAVSDVAGTLEFELSPQNFGDHRVRMVPMPGTWERFDERARRTITVESAPLDTLLDRVPPEFTADIALVWMDVQGHEGYVVRGGGRLWARGVPLVTEVWPYGIGRAGMSRETFSATLASHWGTFAIRQRGGFEQHPISEIVDVYTDLERAGRFQNLILLP